MTLKERIDKYKQESAGKASPEMVAIMQRCTSELQASVPSRPIPTVGEPLPPFSLVGSQGQEVSSETLLQSGPLVLSFFRGMW